MDISKIFLAIIVILIIYAFDKFLKWRKFVNTVNRIPGPKSYPIIGTMWETMRANRDEILEIQKKHSALYGPIYRYWLMGFADIKLERAEHVEKILKSTTIIRKSQFYDYEFRKWLGNGLITSTGEQWHLHRKFLTPTFHFSILEGFCDVFAEKCQIMVEKLKKVADTGETVEIFDYVHRCALDIICETAMGIQMNAQETGKSEYTEAIKEICTINTKRFLTPLLRFEWIFALTSYGARSRKALKTLNDFTEKVIKERKALRKELSNSGETETGKKRKMFLDLVLDETEKRPFFTDQDIREEVDTFMFAGHDTTTAAMSFALYLIGLHPEVQEKLYQEQLDIFGDSTELATYKNLSEMKYMDMVIKECLRIFPSVPKVSRRVTEEVEVGGYTIPVGASVSLWIYGCSRDERYFPNPEKFDPDRFLPENKKNLHPYAFIPFSAGLRNCIGQRFAQLEEKVMLSTMIRNFKITSPIPLKDMKVIQEIVTRPINGVHIILEKRQSSTKGLN
ncbi:cytochrome P450 4C1-like [Culicoides brevitarsis]|uniref:cytochrome P450 4C1-like n=1 Tax=Culicoides brevitarsis TaxID=469753 RepID=UPI00307BA8EE